MRETFDEVCSAIQWIDHPLHIAIFADQLTAFFAHDTVLRIRLADDVDDQMLCIAIDVGDEVIGPFLARFYSVRGFVVFGNQVTGLARSAHGDSQHRMHGYLPTRMLKNRKRREV